MKRLITTLTITGLCTAGAWGLSGGTAAAHTGQGPAVPANHGWHPWPTDGCSTPGANIGAIPGVFDFGHACVHHDGCYKGFPLNGQPTYWVSRSQCDQWFIDDMNASCRWQHATGLGSASGRTCEATARAYRWAVRTFAGPAYVGPYND
jgi:hypothetical protein